MTHGLRARRAGTAGPGLSIAAGLGFFLALGAAPAGAVGDYDPYTAAPNCTAGEVYDQLLDFCVEATKGAVNDRMLYEYAYVLARFDRFDEAASLLDLLQDPETPPALNVRGFVTRKMGKIDEGIGYYMKALELNPDYVQAREYLGEAYIAQGKPDMAREQLAEIEKRCGNTCREYAMLAEAIAKMQ